MEVWEDIEEMCFWWEMLVSHKGSKDSLPETVDIFQKARHLFWRWIINKIFFQMTQEILREVNTK